MDLVIKQNVNQQENGNSALLDLLYNLTKPDPSTGQAIIDNAILIGRISVPAAYEDAVSFLNTHFSAERDNGSDFQVFVLNSNFYIRFADPEVLSVLLSHGVSGDGVGVTVAEAANANLGSWFQDNTDITSFAELPYFTKPLYVGAFARCTSLEVVDVAERTNFPTSCFLNCTALEKFGGTGSVSGELRLHYLTAVGDQSFMGCTKIINIVDLGTVSIVGQRCFANCRGLQTIKVPSTITKFKTNCFENDSSLTGVYIDDLELWETIEFQNYYANPLWYAKHLYVNNTEVTQVTYSADITSLRQYAFCNAVAITSANIPAGVTTIESGHFFGCTALATVNIPSSVTSIGDHAFNGCTNLSSISIPSGVTIININTFANCTALTSVTLPNTLTSIRNFAFQNCTALTTINIPSGITSIGQRAFANSGLTSVTIGNGVTSIGYGGFENCKSLTAVNITDLDSWCNIVFENNGANPLALAHHLYLNGEEVENLVIPNNVTNILNYTFYGCSGLTSVTLPNTVTSIGQNAFNGCSSLASVTIGNSVTSIGNFAFQNCSGLTSVVIPNAVTSIGISAFNGCKNLTHISIPDSVTTLNYDSFRNCDGLLTVEFGTGIQNIGPTAFYNNWNIQYMIFHATTPPDINSNSPLGTAVQTFPIYVPDEYVNTYKQKENWSNLYAGRIKPMSEFPNS